MKKLLLAILFSPSLLFARGGIDVVANPKALLNSTNTWTATQIFWSSEVFKNATVEINGVKYIWPSSLNGGTCLQTDGSGNLSWSPCGSGGGGGGGSGAYFNGNQTIAVTTWTIPFVKADFNGSFASVPVFAATANITGSGTYYSSQTFRNTIFLSSAVAFGLLQSTNGLLVGGVMYTTQLSTADVAINARLKLTDWIVSRDTGDLKNDSLGVDTTTIANRTAVIIAQNAGVRQGDISTLNLTGTAVTGFTCVGTTCTATLTSGAGGTGGSDNLGSHVTTTTLRAPFGIEASSAVYTSSVAAFGGFFSTFGFTGGGGTFTEVNVISPGSVSKPALSFGGNVLDANRTGIYSNTTDNIDFSVAGVNAMNWAAGSITANKVLLALTGTIPAPGIAYGVDQSAGITCYGAAPTRCALTTIGGGRFWWNSSGETVIGKRGFDGFTLSVGTNSAPNDGLVLVSSGSPLFVVTGSSYSVFTPTFTVNSISAQWSSTQSAMPVGDYVLHYNNLVGGPTIYLGGDAVGAGTPGTSSNFVRTYNLVVGTPGSPNVDAYVSSSTNFVLALASVGAAGLTVSATAQARIFFGPGQYNLSGVTVPAGIEIYGNGPSTIFADSGSISTQFMKIWGKVNNLSMNFNSLAFNSSKIQMSSYSQMNDVEISSAQALPGLQIPYAALIYISSATGVRLNRIRITDARATNDGNAENLYGAGGVVYVHHSSDVIMQFDYLNASNEANGGLAAIVGVTASTEVFVVNSRIANLYQTGFVWQAGCVGGGFTGNDVTMKDFSSSRGAVVIGQNDTSPQAGISTGIIVANNTFRSYGTQVTANSVILLGLTQDRARTKGVRIFNNTLRSEGPNVFTFITINSGGERTEVFGNASHGVGTFLTDNGALTARALNYSDGVSQEPASGGLPSLAVGRGSIQDFTSVSSPTTHISFSTGIFKVTFISPTTAYIDINYASATAQGLVTAGAGGGSSILILDTPTITASFDNAGSPLVPSSATVYQIGFDATIASAVVLAPLQSGSVLFNIKKTTIGSFPSGWSSVCAAACPSISGTNQKNQNSVLTGWTTTINAWDIFQVNIDTTASAVTNATVQLFLKRR